MSSRAVAMLATAFLLLGTFGVAPAPVAAQEYSPQFEIHPDGDRVHIWGFPAFVPVSVRVDRDGTNIHLGEFTVDGGGAWTYDIPVDVLPGDVITVTDLTYTKTTTVTPIAMTGFDVGADIVSGMSTPDSAFGISVHETDVIRHDAVGSDGRWSVNLAVPGDEGDEVELWDIVMGSQGALWQSDEDGDSTKVGWRIPSPTFHVLPASDTIVGHDFIPLAAMIFTVGGSPLDTDPTTTNANGSFTTHANADLTVGDTVTASDGTFTKNLLVTSLAMTGISGNVLRGSAETATLHSWIDGMQSHQRTVPVVEGNWEADYGVVGDEPHEQATVTLTPGMSGWMQARDDDGDSTQMRWHYADPRITVSAAQDWVMGWDFPADTPVAIMRDASSVGDLGTTDGNGSFNFPGQQFEVGDTITVSVGGVTRETVISPVAVTSVTGNVVSGVADTPEIQLWVHGAPDVLRHLTVNGGTWSIDLGQPGQAPGDTGTVELAPPMSIAVFASEADGDGTQMNWRVRAPAFDVRPQTDSIWAWDFTPSGTLTVTVTRDGALVAGATSDVSGDGSASVHVPDVLPGDLVTVTDGTSTKATTVTNLQVTDADADSDTVFGTADPGSTVGGWVHNSAANRENEPVDGDGNWTLYLGQPGDETGEEGIEDLVPGMTGGAGQRDADGDSTVVDWRVRRPSFNVHREDNHVWAWDFRPGGTVTVTVSRDGSPDVTETAELDAYGNAGLNMPTDIVAGDAVSVTDGFATKTTTVTAIAVTDVDVDGDTVRGTAAPGSLLDLWVHEPNPSIHRNLEPVGDDGTWAINLGQPGTDPGEETTYDIVPGSSGAVGELDPDGDSTVVGWGVRNPAFNVHPEADAIYGWNFLPGSLVIERNGTTLDGWLNWDPQGNFSFDSFVDIGVGDEITVSDGTETKATTVTNLAIIGVDPEADTIWGTAEAGSLVGAWVWMTDFPGRDNEMVDESGNWSISFSVPGDEDWEQNTFDIGPGSHGAAGQRDEDGDSTMVDWRIAAPAFNVRPVDNVIDGWDFAANSQLYVLVDGTAVDDGSLSTDEDGSFWFDLDDVGVDILPGDLIEVGDGTTAKTTTVTELLLAGVDPDTDVVSGSGLPDTFVNVWINDTGDSREETIAGDGTWTANFAVPGDEDWEGTADVDLGWSGGAQQQDEDGDSTMIDWRVPAPAFNVHPDEDWIDGWDFPPDTALYVLHNGSQVSDGGLTTDEWGNFWFSLADVGIDAIAGDRIEVGDGTILKETTVTVLALGDVDVDTDVISGTAEAGTGVGIWVDDEELYRNETVASDGSWAEDVGEPGDDEWEWQTVDIGLGSSGGVEQRDPDGDGTVLGWRIAAPAIDVSSDLDEIEGWDFTPETEIQLRVNEQTVDTGWLTSDEAGNFWFSFRDNGMEINPGDIVEAGDGPTVKSVVITDLELGGVDVETDTIWGTATAGSVVNLQAWFDDGELYRSDVVLQDGSWLFDVSEPGEEEWEQMVGDLVPGTQGDVYQRDEDGDSTKVNWAVPNPAINVYPVNDAVEGWEFLPNAPITILLDGQQVGDDSVVTDEWGNFWVDLQWLGIDIVPGGTVAVTDGTTTKSTDVTALAVAEIDVTNDLLIGTAAPGTTVGTWCWDSEASRDNEWVDLSGDWVIDLGIPGNEEWEWETYDIQPGSGGDVFQRDEDGDQTVVEWRIRNPQIQANLGDNVLNGWDFGGPVTVTVLDPTGTGDTWSGEDIWYEDDRWELWLDPNAPDGWDLAAGQMISVTGPEDTKVLVVAGLSVDAWDFAANTVSGSTDQNFPIDLWIESPQYGPWVNAWPDAGAWSVSMDDAQPSHQLRILDEVWAQQTDDDGDMTLAHAWAAEERFTVDLLTQQVFGFGWSEGSSVELRIDGTLVATTTAATEGQNNMIPLAGTPNVFVELTPDIGLVHPGDTVTMSDGTTIKEQVIPDLTINLADTEADALSGTTSLPEAGGFLTVEPDWWTDNAHEVMPDPDGSWATSWMDEWDITGNTGFAIQTDADGDQTGTATPDPRVVVDPQANRIWALDFAMGAQLTLTISDDQGEELWTATGTSENVLHRGFWVRDMWTQPTGDLNRPAVGLWDLTGVFDVQATFVVTVTDGASAVSTSVAPLAVDSVDAETDTITGRSSGGVTFNLSEGGGYWGHHVTPVDGAWSYHFDPNNFPFEGLEPGMTVIAVADATWTVVRSVVPEAFHYDFGGFVKPITAPPAVNLAKAGQPVKISFSLGGDYGLDIFGAGSPTSVLVACPSGSPVGSPEATTGTLTYNAKKDLYSYQWALPKAWKGTCRQLVFGFDDGSEHVLNFQF